MHFRTPTLPSPPPVCEGRERGTVVAEVVDVNINLDRRGQASGSAACMGAMLSGRQAMRASVKSTMASQYSSGFRLVSSITNG